MGKIKTSQYLKKEKLNIFLYDFFKHIQQEKPDPLLNSKYVTEINIYVIELLNIPQEYTSLYILRRTEKNKQEERIYC